MRRRPMATTRITDCCAAQRRQFYDVTVGSARDLAKSSAMSLLVEPSATLESSRHRRRTRRRTYKARPIRRSIRRVKRTLRRIF
jgi:hypothetical protein